MWVLYTRVRGWHFTGARMTTSLFRSSGLFSVFLADLNNALVCTVSIRPPISNSTRPLPSLCGPFHVRQSQLVSPSPSCSLAFSVFWQSLSTFSFFSPSLFFILWSTRKELLLLLFSRLFRIGVCWWIFTRVWVIANLTKSPGLLSVFRPIAIMQ